MIEPYLRAKPAIAAKLASISASAPGLTKDFRIASMRQKLMEVDAMLYTAALESSGKLESTLYDLAVVESDITEKMLSSQFKPIGINISGVPFRQVDFIQSNPLYGETLQSKFLKANQTVISKINAELTQSIIQGEDMQRATNRLIKPLEKGFPKGTPAAIIAQRADMIARSEIQYVSNSVARAVYNENQDVLKGLQYLATNDRRTCLICAGDDGKVYKYKDGETNAPVLPRHVRCFIDPQIPIYTSEGMKPIGKIEVGDKVLTHKGRYKKVTELIRNKERSVPVVKIYAEYPKLNSNKNFKSTIKKLTLTEEHPLMTE